METGVASRIKHRMFGLGNFLSGMETSTNPVPSSTAASLGNFLSGMETFAIPVFLHRVPALETSLVEWKPIPGEVVPQGRPRLGNFLSGMETHLVCCGLDEAHSPWKLP